MKLLDTKYSPSILEKKWYDYWMEKKYFSSSPSEDKENYTIVIPPPNVTGKLTMGHVLNNTIQDILSRKARMEGKNVSWIPGTDHASIATESKVAKMLEDKGINKKDISREEFLTHAWEWKEKYGGIILEQQQKLGNSCDWDKLTFTMDEDYSNAVLESFVRLYNKGLIHKGNRLVNWCPKSQTALSDEEVIFKEVEGKLWYIKYKIEDSDTFIEIATTRPETMLGDAAIAVNPSDRRFKSLIGKNAILPLVNKTIPIIADKMVDPEFGTGCVKITPAHDPNDYNVGMSHSLDMLNIMNPDGSINSNAPDKYVGLTREKARKQIIKDLKAEGSLLKEEDYLHKVGYSERGDVPIEYYLSNQWFLKMKELAKPATEVVKSGEIKFYPNHWVKTYNHWMDNIQDWCISRQLYWGHRIPVWYKKGSDHSKQENWYVSITPPEDIENWEQDEDVLDTWFSSWLWPFGVHGWPNNEKLVKQYYPTDILVTGPDIIFFWVARMIISGIEFLDEIPFKDVYFTSILRDSTGRKLSKSLGNSPDPIELFEKYGTDATRFSIMLMSPQGSDVYFSENGLEIGRNFMNKIWNASRFIMINHDEDFSNTLDRDSLDIYDKWILSKLDTTLKKVNVHYSNYQFNEAIKVIYDFTWNEFCNWYIEIAKIKFNSSDKSEKNNTFLVAKEVLKKVLLILHPIAPFITEEIWSYLKNDSDKDIIISSWPTIGSGNLQYDEARIVSLKEIVVAIRTIRSELNVAPTQKISASISIKNVADESLFDSLKSMIMVLTNLENLNIEINLDKPKQSAVGICKNCVVYVPLGDLVDPKEEMLKLNKRLQDIEGFIAVIETKLSNKAFTDKAPEKIVNHEKSKLDDFIFEREKIIANIEMLK
ncbi:MAG: valine--tRNA ligase [bacterium]|jgi:valyl-tRNA synthetase|nr:valine--tRNA ligase [Candidatus Neomarinimicrobiota bacterium]HIL86125.1 valine--tRNA ligase [Candidatus Neomarinimicrobiota bacterium]